MLENKINKGSILLFTEKVECFLFCGSTCENDLRELFINSIDDNENHFLTFLKELPKIKKALDKDLDFFYESDPASENKDMILACYPGYKAIVYYRIAHLLYELGLKVEARIVSEHAHFLTGIDINPGAKIGYPFFIDHGTGVVIGETSTIGNYVKIYQGVTLGAVSLDGRNEHNVKRHPTIKDRVIIYSNATILGGDVVIGEHTIIGSNVFITKSVPDHVLVTIAKPELVFRKK